MEQKKQKFCPDQLPQYLGLFAQNLDSAKINIQQYVKQHLDELSKKFPELQQTIENDFQIIYEKNTKQDMKWPNSLHITSYFVKGGMPDKSEKCFHYFQEGVDMNIEIIALAYVPGYNLCGVAVVDENLLLVKNICPHLTMFIGKWPAFYSNIVLESLFTQQGPLVEQFESKQIYQQEYKSIELYKEVEIIEQGGDKKDIYFIKLGQNLKIPGRTKAFYTGKARKMKNKKK